MAQGPLGEQLSAGMRRQAIEALAQSGETSVEGSFTSLCSCRRHGFGDDTKGHARYSREHPRRSNVFRVTSKGRGNGLKTSNMRDIRGIHRTVSYRTTFHERDGQTRWQAKFRHDGRASEACGFRSQ